VVFVGDEQEDDITPRGCLGDAHDAKASAKSRFFVVVIAVADHYLRHAALAQVLGLRRSLVAVTDDGEALPLDDG
jgi:hypothetical protein